jgi:lipopolysaccharide transport system permease protein
MKGMLLGAWRYRHFVLSSITAEFRVRFARSKLGCFWMIIHPLVQAAIFALVLSEVVGARLPGMAENKSSYAIYLLAGTLAWSLFSEVITRCLSLFIDNGHLLKKIVFPRICLAIIASGSALLNNFFLFLAIVVMFALLGHFPGLQLAWVPCLVILTLALALGIGIILGVFNVFVRDVGQVAVVVLQLLFWLTPIVYPLQIVPESLRHWLEFNPMSWLVQGYQNALLFNTVPPVVDLGWIALASLFLMAFAFFLVQRASPEMVDVL